MKKHLSKAILFSTLNGLLMLFLALFWLSLPRTFGDESFFIKWTSLVKKSVFGWDEKPDYDNVLYVDISLSKSLIDQKDPLYEEYTGYTKSVITNRDQLTDFLNLVGNIGKDIPLVILDIAFSDKSPQDSLLQAALDDFPFPILSALEFSPSGDPIPSVFDTPTGGAAYLSTGDFLKYPLYLNDSIEGLPLAAYSQVSGKQAQPGWLFAKIGDTRHMQNPIIDFRIRPKDLNDGTSSNTEAFPLRSLGSLLFEWEFWEEKDIKDLVSGKTIIVGNFKDDIHETVYGSMPGPLIIHNAYLSLVRQESRLRPVWLLLLFGVFYYLSWEIFKKKKKENKRKTLIRQLIENSITESTWLILATVLSYFIFNIHINILVLLLYLKLVEFLVHRPPITFPVFQKS
ncbi:MAG: hypothetical protein GYB31_07585 [Bacteroidetes bacterium]|nr:hypothetical protein [Bacteroidota bacterium]